MKDVAQPARVALTGRTREPGPLPGALRARAREPRSRALDARRGDRRAPLTADLPCSSLLRPYTLAGARRSSPGSRGSSRRASRSCRSRRSLASSSASGSSSAAPGASSTRRRTASAPRILAKGQIDHRPLVALVLFALILTMQEYYGGRSYFETDGLSRDRSKHYDGRARRARLQKYDELYGFAWWAGTRIGGYVLPFASGRSSSARTAPRPRLRTRGFFDHAWIYGALPRRCAPRDARRHAERRTSAPTTRSTSTSPRSWFDFLTWEAMYFAQFFALEMFFRGFWLGVLRRSFGSGAIFVMAVPYCMIHFGKPYLEAAARSSRASRSARSR